MTRATTLIIAIVALLDGVVSLTATPCTVTMSACGGTFSIFVLPVEFDVDVTDPVDPATLDASDFTVNGIPANSFALINGNMTITFHFTTSPAGQVGAFCLNLSRSLERAYSFPRVPDAVDRLWSESG
jgi:hypothetical protein